MACGILYKDAIVITIVKKVDDSYVLDLPFKIYGQDVVYNGQLVTYSLNTLEGQEVMAKVDYKIDDEAEVLKFAGILSNPKVAAKYTTHYPVTLADSKATYDSEGVKIPYDGVDKNEKAGFCEALVFSKSVKTELVVDEEIIK